MYELNNDIDNEWKEFLSEFMLPLTNNEDDDEADPEYVAADTETVDREELRPVRVSKKELNQLISELLEDTSCMNFGPDQLPDFASTSTATSTRNNSSGSKRQRTISPTRNKSQSPKISSRMYTQAELHTPPHSVAQASVTLRTPVEAKPVQQPAAVASPQYFVPQTLQTPQRVGYVTPPTVFQSPVTHPLVYSSNVLSHIPSTQIVQQTQNLPQPISGMYGSLPSTSTSASTATMHNILLMNAQNQLEVRSLTDTSGLMNQAVYTNGMMQLPQYQSIVIQVPTIDLLQNRISLPSIAPLEVLEAPVVINLTDDKKKQISYREGKLKEFDYLTNEQPPVQTVFNPNMRGMTFEQTKIFEQQMRMHAQLLAQNFIQYYAHPKWWEKADKQKEYLDELEKLVKPEESALTAKHIKECIKLCSCWEQELQEQNERNANYIEFLHTEIEFE